MNANEKRKKSIMCYTFKWLSNEYSIKYKHFYAENIDIWRNSGSRIIYYNKKSMKLISQTKPYI